MSVHVIEIPTDTDFRVVDGSAYFLHCAWDGDDQPLVGPRRQREDVRFSEDDAVFLELGHGPDVVGVLVVEEDVDEREAYECLALP